MKKFSCFFNVFLPIMLFILFGCERTGAQSIQNNNFDKKYQETYTDLFNADKYDELFAHLQLWENKEPDNPEMFIAYFNYFIFRNKFTGISIDKEQKGSGPSMKITDPQSGEIAGYMNNSVQYNTEDILTAVEYLNKGLNITPNRLDMRFGKIHILNEIENYKMAGDELFAALVISKKINNNWLWTDNEEIEDGEWFFINNIQDYYNLWLNAATEEAYAQVKLCTEKQIELYPEHIHAYNVLAICYLVNRQFQEGLKYLLQAEKIDANDCIVLINIGRTYLNMNNKQKAQEYFNRVLEIGNEQDRQYAQYFLNQL
ncbi:MAG: tetratricopeptide repeat protein [Treponema sp.]|jgi:tetratricopeptide (TPR) repeat protein|nr:tetratricopeptide repeat protein [Treponema sp.]